MKYCIDFNKNTQILDKVDEINVFYDKIENLDALLDFCNEHNKQRINVCITDLEKIINEDKLKSLLSFQEQHNELNLYLRFPGKCEELDMLLADYIDSNNTK